MYWIRSAPADFHLDQVASSILIQGTNSVSPRFCKSLLSSVCTSANLLSCRSFGSDHCDRAAVALRSVTFRSALLGLLPGDDSFLSDEPPLTGRPRRLAPSAVDTQYLTGQTGLAAGCAVYSRPAPGLRKPSWYPGYARTRATVCKPTARRIDASGIPQ